jgi:ABC-type thiamine transport system ATPase subunit
MRKDRRHPGILGGPIKSRSGVREAPRRHKYSLSSLSPRERGGVRARAAIARCLLRKEVVTTYQSLTYR